MENNLQFQLVSLDEKAVSIIEKGKARYRELVENGQEESKRIINRYKKEAEEKKKALLQEMEREVKQLEKQLEQEVYRKLEKLRTVDEEEKEKIVDSILKSLKEELCKW